ncbi:MAG: hypothetical protein Q4C58_03805 [Eubacteriales bacterium]|nr:hypothetical protein [Eubacteriales bacterium]
MKGIITAAGIAVAIGGIVFLILLYRVGKQINREKTCDRGQQHRKE